jgi:hypothetical protein
MLRRVALTRATQRNIPGDGILHSHCRENLKSYKIFCHHINYEFDACKRFQWDFRVLLVNVQQCGWSMHCSTVTVGARLKHTACHWTSLPAGARNGTGIVLHIWKYISVHTQLSFAKSFCSGVRQRSRYCQYCALPDDCRLQLVARGRVPYQQELSAQASSVSLQLLTFATLSIDILLHRGTFRGLNYNYFLEYTSIYIYIYISTASMV